MKTLLDIAIASALVLTGGPAAAVMALDRIKGRGKIVIAHRESSAPLEAHAIYERWFMRPIPPKSAALNLR